MKIIIVQSFHKVIKYILRALPKNDYPVLNTFLFISCWLE